MKGILNRILGMFKTRRINVFFVFLVIAFSILIINKLSKNYTNTVNFKVKLIDVPNDIVLQNIEDVKISLQFKNTGFSWLRYVFKQPLIELNFKDNFKRSNSNYSWSIIENQDVVTNKLPRFSNNIKFLSEDVVIAYDKLASKKVPVISNVEINFMSGYNALKVLVIKPDSVVIVGSKTELEKINKIETEALIIQDVNKPISKNVELALDSLNQFISSSTLKVDLSLNVVAFTEGKVKVPVLIINKPKDLDLTFYPKYANVSYYLPLNNYKSINKESFKVVCDYKNVSTLDNFLIPELKILTDKVKTARIKESKIEFIINK